MFKIIFTDEINRLINIYMEKIRKCLGKVISPIEEIKIHDKRIKNSWISLKNIPPWPTTKFLNELSEYEDNLMLDLNDLRNIFTLFLF